MPSGLPEHYEMGTLNISGIAGLNAALKWIEGQAPARLYREETEKRERLIELLTRYDFIRLVGVNKDQKYVGIVSCNIDGISSDSAGNIFSKHGISVRTGLQCAPLAHQFLGTYPAGTIRFSVNSYTSDSDFKELETALDYIEKNL